MTIVIPTWIFWILGGIGAIVALGLIYLGIMFIILFKDFKINW